MREGLKTAQPKSVLTWSQDGPLCLFSLQNKTKQNKTKPAARYHTTERSDEYFSVKKQKLDLLSDMIFVTNLT